MAEVAAQMAFYFPTHLFKFQKAGIQLLYHNHDFEFVKLGGEYALDALYKAIPMPYLATEIDTCWVRVAGVDPAAYLRRYAGRSPVVHLKDFTSGTAAAGKPLYALIDNEGRDGTVDVVDKSAFDFRPLGMGQMDIPAVLKAAEDAGTEWVVVEQDRSTERPSLDAIRLSRESPKDSNTRLSRLQLAGAQLNPGFDPRTFSAGSPMKRSVPVMLCFSIAAFAASVPASADMPSARVSRPENSPAILARTPW
jgi:sugar phosphate isomerase/epimerase